MTLSAFLQTKTNFLLISECHDGASTIADIEAHSPEIAVIDVQLPDMTAAQVIQAVRTKKRTIKIIVLGAAPDRNLADQLLALGADAYVVRSGPSRHLNDAIRYIQDGGKYLTPQLTTDLPPDSPSVEPGFRTAFEAQTQTVARLDEALERAQSAIELLRQKVEKLSAVSLEASANSAPGETGEQRKIRKLRSSVGSVAASLIVGVLGFQMAGILSPRPLSPLADVARAGTAEALAAQGQTGSSVQADGVDEAAALMKQRQYAAAEKLCRALLKQDPANTAASRILASALFHQNRVAESADVVRSIAMPTSAPTAVKANSPAANAKLSAFER